MGRLILHLALLLSLIQSLSAAESVGMRLRYERTDPAEGLVSGYGTAFGIDLSEYGDDGRRWVMTAAHNVVTDGAVHSRISIELAKGQWALCDVAFYDSDADLALLKSEKDLKTVVKIAKEDPLPKDSLHMFASLRGRKVKKYRGKLVRHFYQGTVRALIKTPFDHGASGAPVVDRSGELVGVAVAGVPYENDLHPCRGLIVPMSSVRIFIRLHL